jgi:uncharacterized protein YdeI (YjbR/CyaY-like superfamily)
LPRRARSAAGVDQLLSFGWIDGVRKSLGTDAYMIRISPRKPGSKWSRINVRRAEALIAEGLMTRAGRRVFESGAEQRKEHYSYEQTKTPVLARSELATFKLKARAFAFFQAQAAWYRKAATHWVVSAKLGATRERRLARLIADSARGRTIPPLTRPTPRK